MAIPAATSAAISAIAALAQAGGMGVAGYMQGEAQDEQNELARKRLLLEQQNLEQERRRSDARYAETMAANHRAEVNAAPMNSVNLLSGIANLRNGMTHANGVDVLGYLSGTR